jgi:hypothetical protein
MTQALMIQAPTTQALMIQAPTTQACLMWTRLER